MIGRGRKDCYRTVLKLRRYNYSKIMNMGNLTFGNWSYLNSINCFIFIKFLISWQKKLLHRLFDRQLLRLYHMQLCIMQTDHQNFLFHAINLYNVVRKVFHLIIKFSLLFVSLPGFFSFQPSDVHIPIISSHTSIMCPFFRYIQPPSSRPSCENPIICTVSAINRRLLYQTMVLLSIAKIVGRM